MDNAISAITLLAFDFGMRRIGVAVGQTITGSASPLSVLLARDGIPQWDMIGKLIKEWSCEALVVGLPYQVDGAEQMLSTAARKFAARLREKFKMPVYLVDERFTTIAARSQFGLMAHEAGHAIDSYAAKLILEDWLALKRRE